MRFKQCYDQRHAVFKHWKSKKAEMRENLTLMKFADTLVFIAPYSVS